MEEKSSTLPWRQTLPALPLLSPRIFTFLSSFFPLCLNQHKPWIFPKSISTRERAIIAMAPSPGARSDYPTVASWRRILIKVSFSSRCQPIGILLPCFGGRLRSFWRPFTDRPSSCCSENALANSGGSIFSSGDVLISGLGWYILNGGCSRSAAVSTLVLGGGFSSMVIFRSTVGVSPAVTIISRVVWFLHWECVSNHVGVFCFSCWPAFWRNYSALASVWFLFSVDFAIVCIGFAVLIHVKSSSRLATLVVMHSLADIILTVDVIPFGLLHCACRTVVSCWLYGVVYRLGLVLPCFFFLRWLVTDVGAPYYGWISSRGFNFIFSIVRLLFSRSLDESCMSSECTSGVG